jgi:hypothetical protein
VPLTTAFQLGGGVSNFAREDLRSLTGNGGFWDARAVFGTRETLALEVAYVGAVNPISASGLDDGALLMRHGAEATARINYVARFGRNALVPFGFLGLGWSHHRLVNTDGTGGLAGQDDVALVPMGVGLGLSLGPTLIETRLTYRYTFRDQLLGGAPSADDGQLRTVGLGLSAGYQF